jgi:hypothetical protein
MSALEERLQLLEDERAILQVMYDYGYGVDYGDEELWLDCWTPDAEAAYVWTGQGEPRMTDQRFRGHDELRGFIGRHTHAPVKYHKHLLVEPRIRVTGDRATASSYFARLDITPDEEPFLSSFGRYEDTFVRCADGRWRFSERVGEIETLASRLPLSGLATRSG